MTMLWAYDSETHLEPVIPPLVCGSLWAGEGEPFLHGGDDYGKARLLEIIEDKLEHDTVVCHNAAFDMTVLAHFWPHLLELIYAAYDDVRIECTYVAERLLDIAKGELRPPNKTVKPYSLATISKRRRLADIDKGEDTWRMHYKELDGVPISEWPDKAKSYAKDDAVHCYNLRQDQRADAANMGYSMPDFAEQCASAFALKLVSAWGLRADPERTTAYISAAEDALAVHARELGELGLMHVVWDDGVDLFNSDGYGKIKLDRKASSKKVKRMGEIIEAECDRRGVEIPRTEKTGKVKTDKITIEDYAPDKVVKPWTKFNKAEKKRGTFGVTLLRAAEAPLHAFMQSLINSGRTSASPAGVHNPPREIGMRECYEPRPGYVYLSCDYDSQEIRTLGECLALIVGPGNSRIVAEYNKDPDFDPHCYMAATAMEHITYEEGRALLKAKDKAFKLKRQDVKIPNFGLPGAMGWRGLKGYARGFDQFWTEEYCRDIIDKWRQTWPEMVHYFNYVRNIIGGDYGAVGQIRQFGSGRLRGGVKFTDACNTLFQGLAADITKAALWEASKRCYIIRSSALYGSRIVNYIHDELLLETPEDRGHDAALELQKLMVEVMERYTPHVPPRASAMLGRVWSKDMEAVYDAEGRLIPWEP